MEILANKMTNEWVPTLAALAPEAGCYMSEVIPTVSTFSLLPCHFRCQEVQVANHRTGRLG